MGTGGVCCSWDGTAIAGGAGGGGPGGGGGTVGAAGAPGCTGAWASAAVEPSGPAAVNKASRTAAADFMLFIVVTSCLTTVATIAKEAERPENSGPASRGVLSFVAQPPLTCSESLGRRHSP